MGSMISRRDFIIKSMAVGAFLMISKPFVRSAEAFGWFSRPGGSIKKLKGSVSINGAVASKGARVAVGDTVVTGGESFAAFTVGRCAFLLREHSSLFITGEKDGDVDELKLQAGSLLSVFNHRRSGRRIVTPTAVASIRGTGIYVEAEPAGTYICTCYGTVEIQAAAFPGVSETVKTRHHEQPRYVTSADKATAIVPSMMAKNHTDEELTMLEGLVGRKPPFAGDESSY